MANRCFATPVSGPGRRFRHADRAKAGGLRAFACCAPASRLLTAKRSCFLEGWSSPSGEGKQFRRLAGLLAFVPLANSVGQAAQTCNFDFYLIAGLQELGRGETDPHANRGSRGNDVSGAQLDAF